MSSDRTLPAAAEGLASGLKRGAVRCSVVAASLVLGFAFCVQSAWAQQSGPRTVSAAATLSMLTGTVQHVPVGSNQPQPAKDGMTVAVGDRVLTGAKSFAVVTFLDGSTLVVCPDTDVTVKQVDVGGGKSSKVWFRINFGLVWARVVRLIDPKANFSLEGNSIVASVHDGLIGARQNKDGSFECWTRAGEVTLQDKADVHSVWTMKAGHKLTFTPGQARPHLQRPFVVNQSSLRITASSNVSPLILMAEKVRVAGFVAPGIEVNQVLGSLTGAAAAGTHVIEVPAGVPGPYLLVLEGLQDGPFTVTLEGLFRGNLVYERELSGTIKKGQRLSTQITQRMDPGAPGDARVAKVQDGSASPLEPFDGPLPGNFLLSPEELRGAGGM